MQTINNLKIDILTRKKISIATVGEKTLEELKKYNLSANFTSSKFTSESLAKELQHVKNKRILLARGNLASVSLIKHLERKKEQRL